MSLSPVKKIYFPPILAAVMLAAMFILMLASTWHKTLSFDEYPNLWYGYRVITEGTSAVPDGQRTPIFVLNALFCLPTQCEAEAVHHRYPDRLLVRLPSMGFALLTGILIYIWAGELFGITAALLCLLLFVFNPNFMAHGKQITSDAATSFFFLASLYCFWRWMNTHQRRAFVFTCLAVAGTMISKYTGVLLLPVFVLILTGLGVRHWLHAGAFPVRNFLTGLLKLFLMGICVLFVLNLLYLFNGTSKRTSDFKWQSRQFQSLKTWALPVPLPQVYALGLDYSAYLQENPAYGRGNNYIVGKLRRRARWYAYPVMFGLKNPLGFLILLGWALAIRPRSLPTDSANNFPYYLGIPFAAVFLYFDLAVDAQLGIRYILPLLPLAILYTGHLLSLPCRKPAKILQAVLIIWSVISALSYHPHYMTYFNELIGKRIQAYRYLADSNLEWENYEYYVNKFKLDHPEFAPLTVEPKQPVAGYILVGANRLVGVYDEPWDRWVRKNLSPLTVVANCLYLFHVTEEDFQKWKAEREREPA